jgi:hypothetical protein
MLWALQCPFTVITAILLVNYDLPLYRLNNIFIMQIYMNCVLIMKMKDSFIYTINKYIKKTYHFTLVNLMLS